LPFQKILDDLVNDLPDAIGAIIVDYEGECVQLASRIDEDDIKLLGAYQVIYIDTIREMLVTRYDHCNANSITTKANLMDIISIRIDDDYLVSLVLKSDSLLGVAEHALKVQLIEIQKII